LQKRPIILRSLQIEATPYRLDLGKKKLAADAMDASPHTVALPTNARGKKKKIVKKKLVNKNFVSRKSAHS